jgi:cysteinyl-tRNA synthetase
MSMKYLGDRFDIHVGGIDHIPVHHTNEIAQSEAATGKKWVNYWLHNEFLITSSGKMAKSKGGFLTLQVLVDAGYDPLDYRYFLLGGHYRSQLQFSYDSLDSAKASRASLVERIIALKEKLGKEPPGSGDNRKLSPGSKASSYIDAFTGYICQDLATPRALAELWGLLRDNEVPPAQALAAAYKMDEVLGLGLSESKRLEASAVDPLLAAEFDGLVAERSAAKKAKDWVRADAIRAELKSKGVLLEDGPAGTTWKLE